MGFGWTTLIFIVAFFSLILTSTVFYWNVRWKKKRLGYSYDSTPLLNKLDEIRDDVLITIDGKQYSENVHLVKIRLENTGKPEITSDDFEDNLTFDFGEETKVLKASIIEKSRKKMKDKVIENPHSIDIPPNLFNQNDFLLIKILALNYKGVIDPVSAIRGVNKVEVIKEEIELSFGAGIFSGIIVTGAILTAVYMLVDLLGGDLAKILFVEHPLLLIPVFFILTFTGYWITIGLIRWIK